MNITCGIFLINDKGNVLITHPTHAAWNHWSLPKGLQDPNETYLEAAKREVHEEIGVDLNAFGFKDEEYKQLSSITYKSGKKRLISYVLYVGDKLNHVDFGCSSYVHSKDSPDFPEIDMINWVDLIVAGNLLAPVQQGLVPKIIQQLVKR